MLPNAIIVQVPGVDLGSLLSLAKEALGYDLAGRLDADPIERPAAERFISCLAAMEDREAAPGLYDHLLEHVTVSVLVAADLPDALDIEAIAAMPCVTAQTRLRDVRLLVLTGTLGQWKRTVLSGSISLRRPPCGPASTASCRPFSPPASICGRTESARPFRTGHSCWRTGRDRTDQTHPPFRPRHAGQVLGDVGVPGKPHLLPLVAVCVERRDQSDEEAEVTGSTRMPQDLVRRGLLRNRFQLGYLKGEDVYAWFDREVVKHEYQRPSCASEGVGGPLL